MPCKPWKTTTITAVLRLNGITAAMLLDGPTISPALLVYVDEVLALTLEPGDIVIMGNLPAHKSAGVRDTIEKAGARVLYLPPYSPERSRNCGQPYRLLAGLQAARMRKLFRSRRL